MIRFVWLSAFLLNLAPSLWAEDFPFHLNAEWDYPILGLGMAAGGYGFLQERENSRGSFDPNQYHSEDIPAYDRWAIGYYSPPLSTLSDVLVVAEGLAPLGLAGADWHRSGETFSEVCTEAVLYGEVVAYASALSLFSKSLRVHPRPLAFTDNAPYSERSAGDSRSSFVSEHATGAFAAAVFTAYTFQLKHPESRWTSWVWAGALGTATATAALRVFAGKHFPSDVAAGAALGSLVGYAVPRFHIHGKKEIRSSRGFDPEHFFDRSEFLVQPTADGIVSALVFRLPS